MAVDRKVGARLVLVTDMLAAAGDELRRVIGELNELTEERGHGDPDATTGRDPEK